MLLVPTDFTAADANAFRYAVRLARHFNWKIKLIHVSPIDVAVGVYDAPIVISRKAENEEKLAIFFKTIPLSEEEGRFLELSGFEKLVVEGPPAPELRAVIAEEKPKMAVVARGPKSSFYRNFFGSVSGSLARSATCPVLLVPEKAAFRGFKELVFAADFESVREPFMREVLGLAEEFGSTIQFLHVGENFREDDELKNRLFQHLFIDGEPRIGWGYHLLETGESAELSMTEWLLENPADLVVISTRHRRFWERLTHHSVTAGLAADLLVPMLVLHDDDEPEPDFKTEKQLRRAVIA